MAEQWPFQHFVKIFSQDKAYYCLRLESRVRTAFPVSQGAETQGSQQMSVVERAQLSAMVAAKGGICGTG